MERWNEYVLPLISPVLAGRGEVIGREAAVSGGVLRGHVSGARGLLLQLDPRPLGL